LSLEAWAAGSAGVGVASVPCFPSLPVMRFSGPRGWVAGVLLASRSANALDVLPNWADKSALGGGGSDCAV
jgi:hypothetical protein